MKKQSSLITFGVMLSLLAVGCAVENPKRVNAPKPPVAPVQEQINVTKINQEWGTYPELPPPEEVKKPDAVTIVADGLEAEFNPQVDVLFVIDNSQSMEDDQRLLVANIDRFVEAFSRNKLVDYHIGVTSVWDSIRFQSETESADNASKIAKQFKIGQLRPVPGSAVNYVTKDVSDSVKVLKDSLKIGIEPWKEGGPEFEELFSVVEAGLGTQRTEENKGFLRGKDSQLVVILITDADDSSPNTNYSKLAQNLWQLKDNNKDKVSTYGVLSLGKGCEKDPMLKADKGDPIKILKFLDHTKDKLGSVNSYSLCDRNYGEKLAEIGRDIVSKTLTKVIKVKGMRFEIDSSDPTKSIQVSYGTQNIPMNSETGWTYNPVDNSFIINGKVKLEPEPNAKINIKVTPMELKL